MPGPQLQARVAAAAAQFTKVVRSSAKKPPPKLLAFLQAPDVQTQLDKLQAEVGVAAVVRSLCRLQLTALLSLMCVE